MSSLISRLSKDEQRELLADLNYLNMDEIKTFCAKHLIPYTIWIENEDHSRREIAADDRKGVILDRIRHYLRTGNIPGPTCFPASIVCFDEPSGSIKATDRLFYGQYHRRNGAIFDLLKRLTGGQFKDGAIARIVTTEFWSKGVAPTYQEYAAAWVKAKENYKRPNPEWAFLSDRSAGRETTNWKRLRAKKAKQVLSLLNRLEPGRRQTKSA
jgi:hypothetical protein